jgi:hypothetical protein
MTTPQPDEISIQLNIPASVAKRLAVLIDHDEGLPDLAAVIGRLLDHVQQGVYRPGSWERGWLEQARGDSWQERLESDPDAPMLDRPRAKDVNEACPRCSGMNPNVCTCLKQCGSQICAGVEEAGDAG